METAWFFRHQLHHEIPLGAEQGEFRPETGRMAGVHDLFVENEVLIEDGERVIPELGDRDGGLLRQRVALVKQRHVPLGGKK